MLLYLEKREAFYLVDIIKIVEEKKKLANSTNDKEHGDLLLLQSYAIILGYISAQNDTYFSNYRTDLKAVELEKKINKILNVDFEIIGIKFSSLESFLFYINNISDLIVISICNLLKEYFYIGYNFYKDWYNNHTIIDEFIGREKMYTLNLRNLI